MDYNPREAAYWDPERLANDLHRAYDVCNGCRLCYNLCPSFPLLFEQVEGHDDQADQVSLAEMEAVADQCFQCKVCYVKCPYTPPHQFDLDFPRLMLRVKAIRVRRQGMARVDRFLGDPDRVGRLGGVMPGLANWGNGNATVRGWMERSLGIDRRRRLPRFAPVRFSDWLRRRAEYRALAQAETESVDVVLFSTCTVEYHESSIGQAAMEVLRHNGIRVAVPDGQRCCGMPALDGGDIDGASARAKANVALLEPYARAGKKILALQPTCAMVLRQEYPLLLGTEAAELVAKATQDITEYLAAAMKANKLDRTFSWSPGKVTYHLSCHTKAQGLNRSAKDLLSAIDGTEIQVVDRCAGIDGTWGLKAEFFDASQKVAKRLTDAFHEARGEAKPCSDCALAGLQIQVGSGEPPKHPVELLARAYGLVEGQVGQRA